MLALPDLTLLLSVAVAVLVVTPFLGRHMASVMEGQRTFLSPVLRPVERAVYRVCVASIARRPSRAGKATRSLSCSSASWASL